MADEAAVTETSTETTALDAAPVVAPVETTALGGEAPAAETTTDEAADTSADTQAETAAEVPETYELTAPEGMAINPADLEAATPVFKDLKLNNEQANKLLPVAAAFAKRIQDDANRQVLDGVAAQRKAWLDEAKADTEIGGAQFDANIVTAAKALDTLGFTAGSPFRVLLTESGLGNHPEMIRAFVKVGKAIGDDSDFVRGTAAAAPKQDKASVLYPDDVPKGGQ